MGDKVFKEKEITIKISPGKIIRYFLYLILFTGIFYMGRWSVDTSSVASAPADSPSFSLSGYVVSLFSGEEEEPVAAQPAPAAAPNNTASAAEPTGTTGENATGTEVEQEASEEMVITKYTKVAVSLNGVQKDWKESWGKITQIEFTIKNNEAGIIKPSYFKMIVEGYDDLEKSIPLSSAIKEIKAGASVSGAAIVPKGFAYSRVTAGPLENVRINLILYDAEEKAMGSFSKEFNLQG